MAAHPPHTERLGGDSAQDTPSSPQRGDRSVRSACCGELGRTEQDLADLKRNGRDRVCCNRIGEAHILEEH